MRWRRQRHHKADPSFLFSTWPIPEHGFIVLTPADTARMQAAVNRLDAIGGGVLRLTPGDYPMTEPLYFVGGVSVIGVDGVSVTGA